MQWIKIFNSMEEAQSRLQPNKPQLVLIGEKRICLVKRQNQFFAVQDRCTHNGESLSKGMVNYLGEVICPLHNYRFSLETGRECASRSDDLVTYPVKAEPGGLFIGVF